MPQGTAVEARLRASSSDLYLIEPVDAGYSHSTAGLALFGTARAPSFCRLFQRVAHFAPPVSRCHMLNYLHAIRQPPPRPCGPGPDGLRFMIDKCNYLARLTVAGEIDMVTCGPLIEAVSEAMTPDVHALDIDVSGVTFCQLGRNLRLRDNASTRRRRGQDPAAGQPKPAGRARAHLDRRTRAPHESHASRRPAGSCPNGWPEIAPVCRDGGSWGLGGTSTRVGVRTVIEPRREATRPQLAEVGRHGFKRHGTRR
jgi:hypothetical protein